MQPTLSSEGSGAMTPLMSVSRFSRLSTALIDDSEMLPVEPLTYST